MKRTHVEGLLNEESNGYRNMLATMVALKSMPVHSLERPLEESEIEAHLQLLNDNYGGYSMKEFFDWLNGYLTADTDNPVSPAEKEALLRFAKQKLPRVVVQNEN